MTSSSDGPLRLGGLISGMDTDSIIQQLLSVEQKKIDNLQEEQETNKAKIEIWQELAQMLQEFGNVTKELKDDLATSLYYNKSVTSSNETVATAVASAAANAMTYKVVVSDIATADVAYGSSKAVGYTLPAGGTVVINGASIALSAGDTLSDIATKINAGDFTAGLQVTAMVVGTSMVLQTSATGSAQTIHGTAQGSPAFVLGTDDPDDILGSELGLIDGSGDLINNPQQGADAVLTINGVPVTSASNVVSDVIDYVTFNIFSDGTSFLNVSTDTSQIKDKITEFITYYNDIRAYVDSVRNAKLDDEEFGFFFSDSMMRDIYNEIRRLSLGGVRMGGDDWNGSVTVNTAAAIGATSIDLQNFDAATGTLVAGDMFSIAGDSTVYRITSDAAIAGNQASVKISPPLQVAVAGGEAITVTTRTLEDFGIGTRTDSFLGTDGVMGILDEGLLDSSLEADLDLVRLIFSRTGDSQGQQGVAARLWNWIDIYTKISTKTTIDQKRLIDNVRIVNLQTQNTDIDKQIERLEDRMAQREAALIRQFAELENSLARSQSAGQALAGLTNTQQSQ